MHTHSRKFLVLCLCLTAARETLASYVPPIWQQEVAQSDFVGIIECERAGYGLGQVVVTDSWKGAPTGTRFTLSAAMEPASRVRRLLLAGRQYLLFANRLPPQEPEELRSFGYHSPTSLSRKQADYGAGIVWRCFPLPNPNPLTGDVSLLSLTHNGVPALKRDVLRLLALSPADQEKEALRAVFLARLPRDYSQAERPLRPEAVGLAMEIQQATRVEQVLGVLFQPGPGENAASSAMYAGGEATLRVLLRISPGRSAFSPHVVRAIVEFICSRHSELATNLTLRPRWSPAEELQRMRGVLATIKLTSTSPGGHQRLRELRNGLMRERRPGDVVHTLDVHGAEIDPSRREPWAEVIVAGGPRALDALEALAPEDFGLGGGIWEWCRAVLRLQVGLPAAAHKFSGYDDRLGGDWWLGRAPVEQVRRWQELLAGKDDGKYMVVGYLPSQAFSRLTFHAPGIAAEWLLRRQPGAQLPDGWPDVSAFAGYFADFCPTNRAEFLGRLLTAPHPSVRAIVASGLLSPERERRGAVEGD